MKALGIIAEYNPFHNGHLYQIQKAKETIKADIIIVVMSGNFLQRGEPAILDKWTRAEMALLNGADLIIELPVSFSLQAADYFAQGSIQILKDLKVSEIIFGAESGTGTDFTKAGSWFVRNEGKIDHLFSQNVDAKKTFAAKMQETIYSINGDFPVDLSEPNNQLGFAYAREIFKQKAPIKINVLKRYHSAYHDPELETKASIASATAIRHALFDKKNIKKFIPENSIKLYENKSLVHAEDYWPFLQYRYLSASIDELRNIYQMEDGIEYRLKEKVLTVKTFKEFMKVVKPKHLTYTRLQRLNMYVLLNITKQKMYEAMERVNALHILGFSKKGRDYLNNVKKQLDLPLLSNINQKNQKFWDLDIRAGELYRLADLNNIPMQDFKRNPKKY